MSHRIGAVLVLTLCVSCSRTMIQGQSAGGDDGNAKLQFEVASVKRASPPQPNQMRPMGMRGGPGTAAPTRLAIENYPLLLLIMRAYNVNRFQIPDLNFGPERFDINAVLPEGATQEQSRLMLQNLLTERLNLKLHHEAREMPVYELSVGKESPRFAAHTGAALLQSMDNRGGDGKPAPIDKDGYPLAAPGQWGMARSANGALFRFNGAAITMPEFAWGLSNQLGRTVIDNTGLKGSYDFLLSWGYDMTPVAPPAPAVSVGEGGGAPVVQAPAPPAPDGGSQALISAIQKQLGLRVTAKKGPVDILVVDHFDKIPAQN